MLDLYERLDAACGNQKPFVELEVPEMLERFGPKEQCENEECLTQGLLTFIFGPPRIF